MANDSAEQAHIVFRVLQVLTLIPAWALMAAVISWYNGNTINTPGGVMCLFIVTLLASVWAFCILIAVMRANNTALWIVFWDIVAMGALIAGVATTSTIANYECAATSQNVAQTVYYTADGQRVATRPNTIINDSNNDFWDNPDNCNIIKAAWGLAIANIIMFFITAILTVMVYKSNEEEMRNRVIVDDGRVPVVEKIYTQYPERPRRARRSHRSSRSSGRPRRSSSYIYE
ncbi:hypothetical protein K440DRAFT_587289 [Wilcoxina mikolae CBS 423.85]|nr:hypothetical protein K440DRAFT_587289 [Wilcoxina mikolae CBS 423.85]